MKSIILNNKIEISGKKCYRTACFPYSAIFVLFLSLLLHHHLLPVLNIESFGGLSGEDTALQVEDAVVGCL